MTWAVNAPRFHLKAARDNARRETNRQVAMIVCMAKSDALSFMSDDEGSLEMADQLLLLDHRAEASPSPKE